MSNPTNPTGPVEADDLYNDPRAVPLGAAWQLIDPGLRHQERAPAVQHALAAGALVVVGYASPRCHGDRPVRLPAELAAQAAGSRTFVLSWVGDQLSVGRAAQLGGMEFCLCRVLPAEDAGAAQVEPHPLDLEGLAAIPHVIRQIREAWEEARVRAATKYDPASLPKPSEKRLQVRLLKLFLEDQTLEDLGNQALARIVRQRDSTFRRWKASTLENRIGQTVRAARAEAADLRANPDDGAYRLLTGD